MLTLAVSKGRIFDEVRPLLAAAGFAPDVAALESRSLLIPTAAADVRLIIVRAQDAQTYVAAGAADAGIAGSDVLAENPMEEVCQPLDLRVARCRLSAAAAEDFVEDERRGGRITVATKYVNLSREYFNRRGMRGNYIKLHGTMELAPLVGMADVIVDLVDTGDTLRAHHLRELAVIRQISAMFIINRAAARKNGQLADLQQKLARVVVLADD